MAMISQLAVAPSFVLLIMREEVSAIDPLRVLRVLYLEPRRRDAVIVLPSKAPFCDNPFEIALADFPKQIDTTPVDVIQISQPGHHPGHDGPEPSLALSERPGAKVFPVNRQRVERDEVRPVAPEQQAVECRATVRRQADDLAVEHCVSCPDAMGEFLTELRELLVDVPSPGHCRRRVSARRVQARSRASAEVGCLQTRSLADFDVTVRGFVAYRLAPRADVPVSAQSSARLANCIRVRAGTHIVTGHRTFFFRQTVAGGDNSGQ